MIAFVISNMERRVHNNNNKNNGDTVIIRNNYDINPGFIAMKMRKKGWNKRAFFINYESFQKAVAKVFFLNNESLSIVTFHLLISILLILFPIFMWLLPYCQMHSPKHSLLYL